MTTKDQNIDDYYSHLNSEKEEKKDNKPKVSAPKLKIKAKKPSNEKAADDIIETKKEDKKVVSEEKPKIKLKQPAIISFEKKKEESIKEKKIEPISNEKNEKFVKKEFVKKEFVKKEKEDHKKEFVKKEDKQEVKDKPKSLSIDKEPLERFSNKKRSFRDGNGGSKGFSDNSFGENRPRYKGKKTLKVKGFIENDDVFRRSKKSSQQKTEKNIEEIKQTLVDKTGIDVEIPDFLTVKEFSDKIGIPISQVISEFLKNGMMVNLNTQVDFDTCFIIAEVFNIKVTKKQSSDVSISSVIEGNLEELLKGDDPDKMQDRAPIISIMGHVDHGKTSILDYIRKTQVAAGEAGGITQSIGAYQIKHKGKKITFLDTPGHEAFSIMRARGAKLTDIAIIVVAADEGMKPQTIESINHAKEAGVPIIVAANKMDKQGANLDLVKGQLSEQGLQPEDWGGDTTVVPVSAHTGMGIEDLIEMITLVADIQELKADPTRPAIATVIESHLDSKQGPIATVLVNSGTLKKGDCVVCADSHGRLRGLKDYNGKNIDEAGPSVPVLITGLSKVLEGGDILQVTKDIDSAKTKAHEFQMIKSSKSLNQFEGASLELLLNRLKTGNLKHLKVVLKSDSNGSLEAIKDALNKLSTAETAIQLIHSGVGDINDSDVIMAGTSQAILVGYNVGIVPNAKTTLQNSKIEVINKKVIYHILEKIESIMTGMIDIKHEDVDLGEAKVKQIFFTGKDKMVVGCEIIDGKVENKAKIRVVRDSKKAGSGEVDSLKHGVVNVAEVTEGEFGISFVGDVKVEEGDILEFYKIVQRK